MLVTSDIFAEYKVNKQLSNGLNQQQQKYQTKTTKNQQKVKLLHVLYICVTFHYAPGDMNTLIE